MSSVLQVRNLEVCYHAPNSAPARAVAGISLDLDAGEILGVLGESGSGKSTLAASLLRVLPPNAEITSGSVLLECEDLLRAHPKDLQRLRGARISLIFQEPSFALHPTMRVRDQISEVLRAHQAIAHHSETHRSAEERTDEALRAVFSADVNRIAASYPHQLSGGQRQRVLIAQAVACRPAVLVADEPTASLDATTQHEIVSLLAKLRDDFDIAIILITHNPSLLIGLADRVLVLYAGKIAELGRTEDILLSPKHPYTRALLQSMPLSVDGHLAQRKAPLPAIPGAAPSLTLASPGCAFEPRCADRMQVCQAADPTSISLTDTHDVSCWKFCN